MADLTGAWLGTYWQSGNPTRFEATFVQANNSLDGRISDAGALGEASLQGEVIGRQVSFTKIYRGRPSTLIRYTGTLSEDGNYLSGQWRIDRKYSGPWEAQRSADDLSQALKSFLEKKTPSEPVGV
jgi:hypothetical protein